MDFLDTNTASTGDNAIPLFYIEAVKLEAQSKAEDRPVFRDTEFVKIMLPGFKDIVCRKVRPEDISRWPEHYRKFKEGNTTDTVVGTPIVQWNGITPSQAAACKAFNVRSVEALADLNDMAVRKLPDGYALQEKAKKFISGASNSARISELEAKLADALAKIEALTKPAEGPAPPEATVTVSKLVTSPDGTKTWSGKGRKPNWVKEMG